MPIAKLPTGLSLFYRDENPEGKQPIMLLHGLGANSDSWQLQFPTLIQADFRVLAPDLRGFGRTDFSGDVSIADMAADCVQLLEMLNIPKAAVCGISMGGNVAQQLALDNPQKTICLALINTFAHLRPPRLRTWIYFAWRIFLIYISGMHSQARVVSNSLFPRPDQELYRQEFFRQVMMSDPHSYRSSMRALARFDSRQRLANLDVPTLIITSSQDSTIPPTLQSELLDLIPESKQVIIQDADHAVTVEKPAIVNQAMLAFLSRCFPNEVVP